MVHSSKNGNGRAVILPPTPQVLTGHSLAHRHLDKRQRAIMAADVIDGVVRFVPTQKELAAIFDVNVVYIELARQLSPNKRAAILCGWDSTSFAKLSRPPRQLWLALPAPKAKANGKLAISDTEIENMIKTVGIERTLEVAAAVESNT